MNISTINNNQKTIRKNKSLNNLIQLTEKLYLENEEVKNNNKPNIDKKNNKINSTKKKKLNYTKKILTDENEFPENKDNNNHKENNENKLQDKILKLQKNNQENLSYKTSNPYSIIAEKVKKKYSQNKIDNENYDNNEDINTNLDNLKNFPVEKNLNFVFSKKVSFGAENTSNRKFQTDEKYSFEENNESFKDNKNNFENDIILSISNLEINFDDSNNFNENLYNINKNPKDIHNKLNNFNNYNILNFKSNNTTLNISDISKNKIDDKSVDIISKPLESLRIVSSNEISNKKNKINMKDLDNINNSKVSENVNLFDLNKKNYRNYYFCNLKKYILLFLFFIICLGIMFVIWYVFFK